MRALIGSIEKEFDALEDRLCSLIEHTFDEMLFWKPVPDEKTLIELSIGGCVIRSAAMIEQVFLGITRRLWDDPFEWTLRESLPNREYLRGYINEVKKVTKEAFAHLKTEDLPKRIYLPDGNPTTIGKLLLRTILHAVHHRGQLYAYVHLFSEEKLPRTY